MNRQVYYVYGFMLLVFVILLIVTVCVTVVGTYFLLNSENYHWPWTAFGCGAAVSGYVALYSVHYFFWKTSMTGLLQTAFYFGRVGMFCTALALMCGAVGFTSASAFVRTIYRNVKCD
jgi:transmembrane 9 superfamily protein 3